MTYKLLSNTHAADSTVTVVQDNTRAPNWVPGSVWVLVSRADGDDVLVDPTGAIYAGLDLDSRFAPATVGPVLEYIAEAI